MKGQHNSIRILTGLLIILNVLFLVYYIVMSLYSRFHYDDLHFIWKMQEMNSWEYIKDMYLSRSGRFIGYLMNALHSKFILSTGAHWLLPIVYYILGISFTYIPLSRFLPKSYTLCTLNAIWLFYNLYVLTNIDYPIFTWTCATTALIRMPTTIFLWYLIQKRYNQWYEWILMILLALFLGGGQEAFTPMTLCLYFCYGLYILHTYHWKIRDVWKDIRAKKLITIAILISIAWIIVVIAPGNYNRMSDTSQFIHPSGFTEWIKGYISAISTFAYFEFFYIPYYIVIAITFAVIGYTLRDKITIPFSYKSLMLTSFLVWVGYLMISVLPFVYLWGDFGIQRNYTPAVYITLFTICCWGFLVGYFRIRESRIKGYMIMAYIGVTILIGIQICNNIADIPTAHAYAKAVDERIEYLQKLEEQGQTETVMVEALPIPSCIDTKYVILSALGKQSNKPILYYTSDTDETPNEYVYHFKRVYGISYDFVLMP